MNVRHSRLARIVALTVVVSLPLLGMSGVASAKAKHRVKGCHKTHTCKSGGTGSGSGSGGSSPGIIVTATGTVIQVETNPSFAGDPVFIDSSQLQASCGGNVPFASVATGALVPSLNHITAVLDNDGNATVLALASNCAPGSNVVDASLAVAPFLTALTTLTIYPPMVTPSGVFGFPNPEVATGDTATGPYGPSGDSDIYAEFYVETNPVFAEQQVEIGDTQLESSCLGGWYWISNTGAISHGTPPTTTAGNEPISMIDDDGNAAFVFVGISCASTTSTVIADVLAGNHPTYTNTYTVLPPAPTI